MDKIHWLLNFFWGDWHWIVTTIVCLLILCFKIIPSIPQTLKSIKKAKEGRK